MRKQKALGYGNLYRLLNSEALQEAFNELRKKAAGVDKVTSAEYAEHLEQNVAAVVKQLKTRIYREKLYYRINDRTHNHL